MTQREVNPAHPPDERVAEKVEQFLGLIRAEEGRNSFSRSICGSESSESSETSESSESSEMRELPRLRHALAAADPNQDSWDEILRAARPVLDLMGIADSS